MCAAACAGGQPEGKLCPGVGSQRISRCRSLHSKINECEVFCILSPTVTSVEDCPISAHEGDGSPPGCLSIGSTGQEVIHVLERTGRMGNKFTIRVLSSAGISFSFFWLAVWLSSLSNLVWLRGDTHLPLSAAWTFLGRMSNASEGECSGADGNRNYFLRVCHHCHHLPADVFVRCSVEPS